MGAPKSLQMVIAAIKTRSEEHTSELQSPSAVILEPRKIKSDTVSTVSPSISHESDGTGCHDLHFLNVEL